MKIHKCEKSKKIEKHDLIPNVIDHVFTICNEHENFNTNKNLKQIESKILLAKQKISKQESLLVKSNKIKKDLLEKIKHIDDESFKIKCTILETLGSEI